jgi:hypothetical protein
MTPGKRLTRGALLAGAVAAVVAGASAGAAAAVGSSFTITPGGTITVTAPAVVLEDTATGTTLTCTSSSGTGGLTSGVSPSDGIFGTITALTVSGCTGPQGQPFTITLDRFPFYFGGRTYNATTGVTHGILYKAHGELSGPACTATLAGPSDPGGGRSDARFRFSYANSSGKLKVLADSGFLLIYTVSGCTGLFDSGTTPDPASFSGAYTVSPKQTITSP